MMKRVMVLAVLAASASIAMPSQAACGGVRYGASVDAVNVEDETDVVEVVLIADTLWVCDDGSVTYGDVAIPTTLTVTGDAASCEARTSSDWDPFGFGTGIHDDIANDQTCSADISWGGFTTVFTPDLDKSGAGEDGGQIAVGKDATVENGQVFVDGVEYAANGLGRLWKYVGGEA